MLNVVTLAFLVYHAVTWFQLTPKAMVVRLRGRRVPGVAIAGSAYAGWVVVSVFVAWLVLKGRVDDHKRSVEPLPWLLFSAGGVTAALFLPVLVFLFGARLPARLDLAHRPMTTCTACCARR